MIKYSFIIPHKNTQALLERCLMSIPDREDLEIIIVDDNSTDYDAVKAVVMKFQKCFLYNNEGMGAGGARNTGLKHVKGQWIIFSDADDYFVPNFLDVLDKYKDQDIDIVYHPALSVDSETLEPMPELLHKHNGYFDEYNGDKKTTDMIKYRLHSPWWKMARTDFMHKFDIKFEEVPKGNDVFFTYQIGYFCKNIAVEKTPIYVHTYNRNGISFGKKTVDIRINTLIQSYKINGFYDFINHPEWKRNIIHKFYEIIKYDGIGLCVQTLINFLVHYRAIQKVKDMYVEELLKRQTYE